MLSVCNCAVIFDDSSCLSKANKSRVHLPRRVHLRLSGWLAARIQHVGVVSVVDGSCQILIGSIKAAERHIFIL
jgi:hypothetical protein